MAIVSNCIDESGESSTCQFDRFCISVKLANGKRGGDKNILRPGKGDLSDKCGHLPSSNHPPGKQRLAKQLLTTTIKLSFCRRGKVTLVGVPSSRNRFLVGGGSGCASQRFCCQPVMTLLDTIGHLARLFNSLRPEAFLSFSPLGFFSQTSYSTGQHTNVRD